MTSETASFEATIRNCPSTITGFLSEYDAYRVLMMHMDGANDGTTLTDVEGHTINRTGVVTKTATKQFGTASAYFNGTSDYFTIDSASDLAFGTGDFTVMLWANFASVATSRYLVDARACTMGWFLMLSGGKIYYGTSDGGAINSNSISANTWYQIVVTRESGSTKMYINGTQAGSTYSDANTYTCDAAIAVGKYYTTGIAAYMSGYIDEFAIWKGAAIPVGSFYPQTVAVAESAEQITTGQGSTMSATIQNVPSDMARGSAETFEATITNQPGPLLSAIESAIEAAIVNRPIVPTAQIIIVDPVSDGSLLISAECSQTMTDKMVRASFRYNKATTGTTPNFYFKHVHLQIPDYTGTLQTVFVGFFPSGSATYGDDGDSEVFTAYDYAWYLTMQYLSRDNLVLLTPDHQATSYKYRLYYHNPTVYWKVGQLIIGGTNGNMGRIIENHLVGAAPANELSYVVIDSIVGSLVGGHYFADGELLSVNGVACAYADGNEVDVTGTAAVITPDKYVCRLLGRDDTGSQYEPETGILPYQITPVTWSSSSTPPAADFLFELKTTKMQAIERICKDIKYVFVVKVVGTVPCAYFIPEADIDNVSGGLDLPAAVTVTPADKYLVAPVTLNRKGEEKYNVVTVRCQSLTGIPYESTLPAESTVLDSPPIEYSEDNPNIATQADCDLRCADLYAYYSNQIKTWTATFNLRSDFRLLQKLIFSGSVRGIPDDTYRIVGIRYNYADEGTTNQVTCTLIPDSQFKFYLNLNRVFTDSISEIQAIAQDQINKMGAIEVGTATTADAGVVTVTTKNGVTKIGSDPTV